MTSAALLLGHDGPFAQALDRFAPREEQQILAEAVETALSESSVLVGEAGTGVGKTFAYLVPAVLSGGRTLISTGTRHLQDQLFRKDLPLVCQALGRRPRLALLKGRANYLCKGRLAMAAQNPTLRTPELQQQLRAVEAWALRTRSGDISECSALPEDAEVWPHVVSQEDFCRQHEHDDIEGCFVTLARRTAQEAELVVVNHHLLCADMALKDEGFGEILPNADALIIDEAHQIPDVASQFFGHRISTRHLQELSRDIIGAQLSEAPDAMSLRADAERLELLLKQLRLAMGEGQRREAWQGMVAQTRTEMLALRQLLEQLAEALTVNAGRGKQLDACQRRLDSHKALLERFLDSDDQDIRWFETYRSGFALNVTPLQVSAAFRRALTSLPAAWVFVSATLSIGGDFAHFRAQLGLDDLENISECQLDSPFDYARNATLFVPSSLPAPQHPDYLEQMLALARPVIDAAGGRSFVLFTSHRALDYAAALWREHLPYPLFVQGDRSKADLIEAFREAGNGVLLGTSSFWEGVDVRGEALSCVIIDRLPFASPGDPVLQARIESIREAGGNAFFDYQLPQAIVALKQGVGRLIRDHDDRGVLMLCDPRTIDKPYGRSFVHALPPMRRTRRLDVVQHFFAGTLEDAIRDHRS